MKNAIKYIQSTTIDFLNKKIGEITHYQEANEVLRLLSGIDTFF